MEFFGIGVDNGLTIQAGWTLLVGIRVYKTLRSPYEKYHSPFHYNQINQVYIAKNLQTSFSDQQTFFILTILSTSSTKQTSLTNQTTTQQPLYHPHLNPPPKPTLHPKCPASLLPRAPPRPCLPTPPPHIPPFPPQQR